MQSLLLGFSNGLLIGEFFVVAFWVCIDEGPLKNRLLIGTACGLFLAISLIAGLQVWPGMPLVAAIMFCIVGVVLPFIDASMLFLISRWVSTDLRSDLRVNRPYKDSQFGVGYLMMTTLFVALTLALIRLVLPSTRSPWLNSLEFLYLAAWFVWLAVGTSLTVWGVMLAWIRPNLFSIAACVLLASVGPGLFQWISSQFMIGQFQFRFRWFDSLPYAIAMGLVFTGSLLGFVYRRWGPKKPKFAGSTSESMEEKRMSDIDLFINNGLVKSLQKYAQSVSQYADALSEEQFWKKPFPYGNSFGHLVLHLTGNLSYYIGAQIAQNGYVRNRDLEFNQPHPPSKAEALQQLEAAIQMAIATIEQQTFVDWATPYSATGMPEGLNRFEAVLQCVAHVYHHLGQMIYLQKEWGTRPTT